jgi:hypothetical protein
MSARLGELTTALAASPNGPMQLDDEELRQMEALGYVDSPGEVPAIDDEQTSSHGPATL